MQPHARKDQGEIFWAQSIAFSDPATCAVESVEQVCVAVVVAGEFRCEDPCVEPAAFYGSMLASTTEPELLRLDCPSRADALVGPVDERFVTSDESFSHMACAGSVPAELSALCACQETVCAL